MGILLNISFFSLYANFLIISDYFNKTFCFYKKSIIEWENM